MKCVNCGRELTEKDIICPACRTRRVTACMSCGRIETEGRALCPRCGGEVLPVYDLTVEEMRQRGFKCFIPFADDHIFDIYLGGNRDREGYVFHNEVGYTGELTETVVLPSMVNGHMIHGVWNEFFCNGDCFFPAEVLRGTLERMLKVKKIVVSNGIKDIWTFAFIGCSGLETLVLPRSVKRMKYDFYDLLSEGLVPLSPGQERKPITICYEVSRSQWEDVDISSRLVEYMDKGYVILRCAQADG